MSDGAGVTIRPPCQTRSCERRATALLRSKQTGTELQLCEPCASRYHEYGWWLIVGAVQLRQEELA